MTSLAVRVFICSLLGAGSVVVPALAADPSSSSAGLLPDHPRLSPERDVVVTYRFQSGSQNGKNDGALSDKAADMKRVRVFFAAAGDRLRIEQIDGTGVTILDRPAQRVTLLSTAERSYVQFLPMHGLRNPFLLDLTMQYTAGQRTRIAGTPCQEWSIESHKGHAKACVTDDGVILAESGVDADGISGRLEALDVVYKDIPASMFEPPADFHKIMPHMVQVTPQGVSEQPVPEAGMAGNGGRNTGSSGPAEGLPGMQNDVADTSQPRVPNDSAGDGTVQRADQPGSRGQ